MKTAPSSSREFPATETRTDVRAETPILAFLATLQEIAENERGIQWHPELTLDDKVQHKIYKVFVERARKGRQRR